MREYLKELNKEKSVYEISLDVGVSEGTLLRYMKQAKLKPQTIEIIENWCRRQNER